LVTGLVTQPLISAKNLSLKLRTVVDLKSTAAQLVINYPAQHQGLSNSVMIDNQDDDAWIEQINLAGPSTNTQVTSQVSPIQQIAPYGQGVTN